MKTKLQFINHASVLISTEQCGLLSDPWYSGSAFNKGWNLLVEQPDDRVQALLNGVTYIWVSHEHPDHFSVKFFNTHAEKIKQKGIKILFQETCDGRVKAFLSSQGFTVVELPFNQRMALAEDCEVVCIKDGFYDSALHVTTPDLRILNLNDCELSSERRINGVQNLVGPIDILLSQFSYAAWKGGKDNITWRKDAAAKKIETLRRQVKIFKPKYLIPFASFVYFSNPKNFYLNDSINSPIDISLALEDLVRVVVMKPFDEIQGAEFVFENKIALEYWGERYSNLSPQKDNSCCEISIDELKTIFSSYHKRVKQKNDLRFMRLIHFLSPIKAFQPITIYLDDLKKAVLINIFSDQLVESKNLESPDLIMSSEQLSFILKNSFGFDSLTVNGCFEEGQSGGFTKSAKTLAIENFNNLGFKFNWSLLLNFYLIKIFLEKLLFVTKKLNRK